MQTEYINARERNVTGELRIEPWSFQKDEQIPSHKKYSYKKLLRNQSHQFLPVEPQTRTETT